MIFDRENWEEILSALKKNKTRTFLTALGVFWGIFMLIIMTGAGNGLRNGVSRDMGRFATNSMWLWTQGTSMPYKGLPRGRRFSLLNDDVEALYNQVPEIAVISPGNQIGGYRGANNVNYKTKTGAYSTYGYYPEVQLMERRDVMAGRFLNELDIKEKRKVCVIGEAVVKELFEKGQDPLNEHLEINGVYFTIIGTYKTKRTDDRAEEDEKSIFIPFTTFQMAFNYGDRVGWMGVISKDNFPVAEMEKKIMSVLKERHRVHPDDDRAFGHWNMQREYNQMQGLFLAIKVLSLVVGLLTLMAGCIGVSNIMLIIIKERTKEIGIRRAIGATPMAVKGQIIMESVFLTCIAGVLGVIFGVWTLEAITVGMEAAGAGDNNSFHNPGVSLEVVLVAMLVLVVSGALAGLIPASRAVSIRPVEALKDE